MWTPKVKTIAALDKGLTVLDVVRETNGASLHELHLYTGLPKATLLRLLVTLERRQLVWRRIADGFFCPGSSADATKHTSDATNRLAQCAASELHRLQQAILWPSDLAVRSGTRMMLCETNRSQSYFMIRRDRIGVRVNMLRSAIGRAFLAFCPDKEREHIVAGLRRSSRPGDSLARDPASLDAVLQRARRMGYGVREESFGGDYDRSRAELDDRLNAIAVPILSGDTVLGCITIVWIQGVRTVTQIAAQHLDSLHRTATAIAVRMENQQGGNSRVRDK
ncbi:helix-turn-helix domain-containing protein [Paraburkholderia domus]|uniref:helix-turn-helix domain-containing protein n=1 Tax=Paraburkholderia domus TaxID=2793075 RepID=UPI001B2DD8AD|nr:helix-turn-helix domain-containing protein [Paraburkholderia domus]CAE6822378.1 hypothetical protein R75483_06310 [Paraburkholderia domus]